jgi:hypothetical protein
MTDIHSEDEDVRQRCFKMGQRLVNEYLDFDFRPVEELAWKNVDKSHCVDDMAGFVVEYLTKQKGYPEILPETKIWISFIFRCLVSEKLGVSTEEEISSIYSTFANNNIFKTKSRDAQETLGMVKGLHHIRKLYQEMCGASESCEPVLTVSVIRDLHQTIMSPVDTEIAGVFSKCQRQT